MENNNRSFTLKFNRYELQKNQKPNKSNLIY